ncbi:MAG: hypothetical protein IRZ28_11495 [Steroidobacteraceae bacterium]|nr:hypothetical protein [Steroidobacteraceae bacterium]
MAFVARATDIAIDTSVTRFATPRGGVFATLDLRTNRIAWRQPWVDQ